MSNMLATAVALLALSASAADPMSLKVKTALIEVPSGATIEVDGGVYLNQEGRDVVYAKIDALETQNKAVIDELNDANKKIADCAAYVPGLPAWASAVISAILTAATLAVGYLVVNPPNWIK